MGIAGLLNPELNFFSQKKGETKREIIPGITKRVLFGALDEVSNYWVRTKNRKYDLAISAQMIANIFIYGIKL